ncbi:GNAT family N-acetyltransferase [Sphingomonas naphthae]|uniref:GNAT family N-acetyltransferase n=1 Tax=Sphingomonas naphthae TaxID=1813468 RepID=A0ABY7TIR1_9SPHN|nr:GNAT family N-acetyltransferase [Sphingomonas naphthae]WCT73024.1 GNAT family N-acetyltransferase [Sphingomonas naphthae]
MALREGLSPLDRPIWSALTSGWAHLAEGDARALRLDPAYGPFAATPDRSEAALAALPALIPPGGALWLVDDLALAPPPGTIVTRSAGLLQMVAETPAPADPDFQPEPLTEADAPAMRALAHLTVPGPFHDLTHRLSPFVGVKQDGRLIAMAGERMRMDGLSEVSGICTHPDARGRGLARALTAFIANRIAARGETPFLHCYPGNAAAVALYERLGFVARRELVLTILATA